MKLTKTPSKKPTDTILFNNVLIAKQKKDITLTKKELAKRININENTLHKKIYNERVFRTDEVVKLKKILNLTDKQIIKIFLN